MKQFNVGLCAIVVAIAIFGLGVVNASPLDQNRMLGAEKCTWGPSYWCSNITNAKGCHAVRHCIQTVWENHQVPVDNDSICQICKDMVTQARDQLRSNETMEELKEVFEGSCNLIPIKIVKKECSKLADDFIPELVEALSSQMNPDQVCSVAGLCNNAEIDKLLMKYYSSALDGTMKEEEEQDVKAEMTVSKSQEVAAAITPKKPLLTCGNCFNVATMMTNKFQKSNRDDILENILHICGEMSSFSDACANIVLTYFNDIYDHIKENMEPAGVCHVSGVCAANYHRHPEDPKEEEPIDLMAAGNDDIPCELCQQLVTHLRDLLTANTTEIEFKQVLEGLCNQTKGFRTECLSIVDQYYDVIYQSLVNNLDANGACFLIGVCPKGSDSIFKGDIMPLLPVLPPAEIKITIRKKLGANEPKFTQEELHAMTLPIDHLMGAANPSLLVENGELCTLCEYLLHFIQETLATPATEDEIKRTVNGICNKFPNSIKGQCHNFIDMYGDAVIALLIQGLNPREICPKLQMCPPNHEYHDDMEVFDPQPASDEQDKPTCPLCLFAVEQAQAKIQNDKSKKNIVNVLNNLCSHLPQKLQNECVDFIQTYSSELIDMLITDFKAQDICVALKLCPKSKNYLDDMGISMESENSSEEEEDIAFNEINNSEEWPVEIVFQQHNEGSSPNCLLCEELVKMAEKRINKHTTKDDIKKALDNYCSKFRKNLQPKCHKYVDKYGDKIADLLLKQMEPKLICAELGLCLFTDQEDLEIDEALKYDVIAMPNQNTVWIKNDRFVGMDEAMTLQEPPTCVLCEFVMTKLEADLKNKTEQDDIKRAVERICNHMPKTVAKSCDKFVDQYANAIIALVGSVPPKEICQKIQLCLASSLSEVISDEVIECGVCHGASMALMPYFRKHTEHDTIGTTDMISVACENLPAKYYQICSEMVRIYGKSIMHLSERIVVDESHICSDIGKCFDNEKSNLAYARIAG